MLTLDGSQARQHRWTSGRAGTAAKQTPPSIMGRRCLHSDFVLKI